MIVLVGRWSWKGHLSVILRKSLHIHSGFLGDRALSEYDSISVKMLLKRPFIGYTGKALAMHIHC